MHKPVYVVCVFNVYADCPDAELPDETPAQKAERKRCRHFLGLTPDEAEAAIPHWCVGSCDYNWYVPTLLGTYPTRFFRGREIVDVETLTCPHCKTPF